MKASTGALLWSYATGSYVESSPVLANGVVYVGSDDDNVYALNARTGHKLWSYATGGQVYSSPVVANGVVYIGSDDGKLYAFSLRSRRGPMKRPSPRPRTTAKLSAPPAAVCGRMISAEIGVQ